MGYLAYEAATLLDGHPAPEPDDAPCPPIGLLRDRPRGGVRPLAAAAHPDRARPGGRLRRRRRAPSTTWPRGSRRPRRPALAPSVSPQGSLDAGEAEHARRAATGDGLGVQGAHPGRRHLPGRSLAAGVVRRAGRRVPDLPAAPRDEPCAVHVLRADARDGAGRLVARAARPRRGPARLRAPDRRHPPARADRDPRPAPRARAARRPEGAGGARDARRPGPQRPRSRLRRRARSGRPS